jgi:excinuclease UvrABC ATPase subunit
MQEFIEISGATENNLKNVSVLIPKKQITIVTGISGLENLRLFMIYCRQNLERIKRYISVVCATIFAKIWPSAR